MMQRQVLRAYGEPLRPAPCDLPIPSACEVLVQVDHCGVCHSDLHLQDGYFDLGDDRKLDVRALRSLPFTLGHEIAGRVVAVGDDGDDSLLGRFVAIYPWIGCGKCKLCLRGDEHLCDTPLALGISVDGGFASHVMVPDGRYLLDLAGVPSEGAGCLMCSGLTAFSALKKSRDFLSGGPLLIVGLGGVGMMALCFARAMYDGPVYVADVNKDACDQALAMGATEALDPGDPDARKRLLRETDGGAGAVIDFVGSTKSLRFAQSTATKGGAVIVVGLMGGSFSIPAPLIPMRALTICGSYVGSLAEAREMLDLVRTGNVGLIPVTEMCLDNAAEALDILRGGRAIGRIVLRPDGFSTDS